MSEVVEREHKKLAKVHNDTESVFSCPQRNWVFVTSSNFLIPIYFKSDDVNLWYFRLRLSDLTESIVWNI